MTDRLTERLLRLNPELLTAATTDTFLRDAGKGDLRQEDLEAWLTQDRLYITCGYVPLIGSLLQKIPATEEAPSCPASARFSNKLRILTAALTNIDRELKFFEDTAAENGLNLGAEPPSSKIHGRLTGDGNRSLLHHETLKYIDHIDSAIDPSIPFEKAIVLLWAMEIIYLKAWQFAASQRKTSSSKEAEPGMQRALDALISNWTSPEFVHFVDQLAGLIDEIGADFDGADDLWIKTLLREIGFWKTART